MSQPCPEVGSHVRVTKDPDDLGLLGRTGILVRWERDTSPWSPDVAGVILFRSGMEWYFRSDCFIPVELEDPRNT